MEQMQNNISYQHQHEPASIIFYMIALKLSEPPRTTVDEEATDEFLFSRTQMQV